MKCASTRRLRQKQGFSCQSYIRCLGSQDIRRQVHAWEKNNSNLCPTENVDSWNLSLRGDFTVDCNFCYPLDTHDIHTKEQAKDKRVSQIRIHLLEALATISDV